MFGVKYLTQLIAVALSLCECVVPSQGRHFLTGGTLTLPSLPVARRNLKFAGEVAPEKISTYRPVIGVLSQPQDEQSTYIAGSYISYLEMSGARVIPVFSDSSEEEHRSLFSRLNGLLVPGVLQLVLSSFAFSVYTPASNF